MNSKKILLPVGVILLACLAALVVLATAPEIERTEPKAYLPAVRVMEPHPHDVQLWVRSQGTVVPRSESSLVPEVSGPVVWISPALASGGFFSRDDPLLRIDPRDYQTLVARARAEVARSEGEAEYASSELERQQGLAKRNATSSSQLSAARRADRVASATLEAAWAALYQAQRDLDRCELRAPFDGRVRDEKVAVGQFVARGQPVGTLYATDFAEIRLPLADHQLAFLDMETLSFQSGSSPGPEVILKAQYAGQEQTWQGQIVRTEGEIDPRSRMLHVVAQVEDPYGTRLREDGETRLAAAPLAVGLFVRAEIAGRIAEDVIIVPRSAIRDHEKIVVVDAANRVHLRDAEILRVDQEKVLIRTPTEAGERIGTSSLQWVVEGMKVLPLGDEEEPRT